MGLEWCPYLDVNIGLSNQNTKLFVYYFYRAGGINRFEIYLSNSERQGLLTVESVMGKKGSHTARATVCNKASVVVCLLFDTKSKACSEILGPA